MRMSTEMKNVRCHDCGKDFFWKELIDHHQSIDDDFRQLLIKEENVRKEFGCGNEDVSSSVDPLHSRIDEWKKESIQRIKQISKQVKEDLRQRREQFKQSFNVFHQHLQEINRRDLHLEKEVQRLNEQLKNLHAEKDSLRLISSLPDNSLLQLHLEPTTTTTTTTIERPQPLIEGSTLRIVDVDRLGHYLLLENVGLKDVDLVGWSLQGLKEDSAESILHRFSSDCRLESRQSIRILSQRASESPYSFDRPNCWIASSISNWIFYSPHSRKSYRLIDPQGQEKHIFILQ